MGKANETAVQRRDRVCGMFLDYWQSMPRSTTSVLLAGTGLASVYSTIKATHRDTQWWSWLPEGDPQQHREPPDGYFDTAILRIPVEKDRLKLCLEILAHRLRVGATLWVFGANDEGIRSVRKLGSPFYTKSVTVSTRKHARIEMFTRLEGTEARASLDAYAVTHTITWNESEYQWLSFPGNFAKGRLDQGSQLLLDSLPTQSNFKRILDVGCGTGILLGFPSWRGDKHALDRDYFAIKATQANVPDVHLHWSHTWVDPTLHFDLIISNPPIHDGKTETYHIVENLISNARSKLSFPGELWMVVQHRVPIKQMLGNSFGSVEVVRQDGTFKVWRIQQSKHASRSAS